MAHPTAAVALVAAGLLASGGALAQAQAPPSTPAAASPTPGISAIPDGELSQVRGGQTTNNVSVLSQQQLSGTTTGNSIQAGSIVAGAVSFSSNALQNYSGVGNFVINTGANNTLQGAINISIVAQPPP